MPIESIRSRLFVTFGALTAGVCIVFAGITWLFAVITEYDVVKQVMHTEARFIQAVYKQTGQWLRPRVDYILLFNRKDELNPAMRAGVEEYQHEKEFDVEGHNFHFERFELGEQDHFWLVIDAAQIVVIDSLSKLIGWFVGVSSLLMLVVSLVAAKVLSNRTARPLELLTAQINQHSAGSDFAPHESRRQDEIGQLGRAFEQALNEIDVLLQREKNFVRDVSHELRTPLAILQNTLVLSAEHPIGGEDKVLLGQISDALKNTVEVLLALARAESLSFEKLKVMPIVERSILALHQSQSNAAFDVRLEVEENFSVEGNGLLLSLLCQNLINNGFYHGGSGSMCIANRGAVLVFENDVKQGPGKHYQGLGHGQYLVQRIADALQWRVNIIQTEHAYRVEIDTQPVSD